MSHSIRGKIKSIIIIALLLTSLIQVGILWEGQIHGFPISFISWIFRKPIPPMTDAITRNHLFIPYRIVVSNGEEAHWIISDDNALHKQFWDEARGYLNEISNGDIVISSADKADWGDVTTQRGFLIDFNYTIKANLMNWFLGKPVGFTNIPDVTKMMIVPDSSDESTGAIYMYDREDKNASAYRYYGVERKESFADILKTIETDTSGKYREYQSMRDLLLDSRMDTEPDVLFLQAQNNKPRQYGTISCDIPSGISNIDELSDIILSNEKERYSSNDINGLIQFSNENNLYKISQDGLLEYENLSDVSSTNIEKSGVGEALRNSYEFINRVGTVTNNKSKLQLTDIIDEGNGRYKFSFDYYMNGMPIFINIKPDDGSQTDLHAIVIEADNKQLLSCRWYIREFTMSVKAYYNDFFLELASKSKLKNSELSIKDITVGYAVMTLAEKVLEPVMVIEKKDKTGVLPIDMIKEKGG